MNNKKEKWFVLTFDVLFIMILCFATLLSTMLMRGTVIVGGDSSAGMRYSLGAISFTGTFIAMGAYLLYVLTHSKKELKNMIGDLYDDSLPAESTRK